MYDVAVIGAGVVGAFCARELKKYDLDVVVAESAEDVAAGASRANSGIVHAGFDAPAGSLKAKFNLEGNRRMEEVCRELGVKFIRNGSLVLAGKGQEEPLQALFERGIRNGVTGLAVIGREQLLEMEPNAAEGAWQALYAPTGGVVCPYGLTIAAMGNAMDNGAALQCGFKAISAERCAGGWTLHAQSGQTLSARVVINCAGYGAAQVAALFGDRSFRIGARKGEYMLLDKSCGGFVRHTMFSLPTAAGKGVLVTPTADGNVLVGPTSVEEAEYDVSVRREGFDDIRAKARLLMKDIPFAQTITSFAGVRAYSDRHDFIVEWSSVCEGLFHVAGIESPGLTSAPALGAYAAEQVAAKLGAGKNEKFDPVRRPQHWFRSLSDEEKNEVISRRPEYGKIVCRCEEVTLGEILDAMRANPPAHTLDGVKLRTRAGMGRCQSGFCQPSVFDLLRTEYGLQAGEVTKNGGKSFIIAGGEL